MFLGGIGKVTVGQYLQTRCPGTNNNRDGGRIFEVGDSVTRNFVYLSSNSRHCKRDCADSSIFVSLVGRSNKRPPPACFEQTMTFDNSHLNNGWFSPDLAPPCFFRRRFVLLDLLPLPLLGSPLPTLSPSLRVEALGPSPDALSLV